MQTAAAQPAQTGGRACLVAQGSLLIAAQRTAPAHLARLKVALIGDAVLVGHSVTGQGASQRQAASTEAAQNNAHMHPTPQ